jgi:hypothetical protein
VRRDRGREVREGEGEGGKGGEGGRGRRRERGKEERERGKEEGKGEGKGEGGRRERGKKKEDPLVTVGSGALGLTISSLLIKYFQTMNPVFSFSGQYFTTL